MKYLPTIGLEIHAELQTFSKMFCGCKNDPFVRKPNIYICPVCLGMPGSLPVLNRKAVEMTVMVGLALNCQISKMTKWDRKNYFYPDLPKGYQISQYDLPLCQSGYFEMSNVKIQMSNEIQNPKSKKIRIRRVHLEEDTGKLIHPAGANYSLVDFNRTGVPLMEMVTEPDITSAEQAKDFAKEIQKILRTLKVSAADMEKGQMRVEANISLRPISKSEILNPKQIQNSNVTNSKLGTKIEIKNLNSFRAVERAINYEIKRQTEMLEKGEKIVQETRGWDEKKQQTFSQRSKEEAPDYRYFPEPDLPPVAIDGSEITASKKKLPELPSQLKARLIDKYQIEPSQSLILSRDSEMLELFEQTVKLGENPQTVARLIINRPQFRNLKPQDLKNEIAAASSEKTKVSEDILEKIIKENQKAVQDYKKGKENALQFLVGQVMKETGGGIDPESAKEALASKIFNF